MKNNNTHDSTNSGQAYWRSLDELSQTPGFMEKMKREFPEIATEVVQPRSRRDFLKFMGASLALAGLALSGCRWPEEKIAPYANRPEGFTAGSAVQYATAMELGCAAVGLLVTSYDGRPIKIEGNPDHPGSVGGAQAVHQASVLELYDPSRVKDTHRFQGDRIEKLSALDRDAYLAGIATKYREGNGKGLALLLKDTVSPSVLRLRRQLTTTLPESRQYIYEPVSRDNSLTALRALYGDSTRVNLNIDKARVIACFDDDILLGHPNSVRYARDYAAGRSVENGAMNRLYAFESRLSLTGMNADHREPIKSHNVVSALAALAAELFLNRGLAFPPGGESARILLGNYTGHPHLTALVRSLAGDLLEHQGRGIVTVGPRQPAGAHALADLINTGLGNTGSTVELLADPRGDDGDLAGIKSLVQSLNAGAVETLVVIGGNPVYDAPGDLGFAEALSKAGEVIYLSVHDTETTTHCSLQINQAHYLETWGDTTAWDGTYSIVQPLIAPLYGGLSEMELLARLAGGEPASGHDLVQETFNEKFHVAGMFAGWEQSLKDGIVHDSGSARIYGGADYSRLGEFVNSTDANGNGFEVVLVPDLCTYDGRFANNGWLQELPDAITKITWDNAAQVSIADANRLGIREGDLVRIDANGRSIEIPAYVMPGQAEGSITVQLGYGRFGNLTDKQNRRLDALHPEFKDIPRGVICRGVGVDAFPLRTTTAMDIITGATVTPTGASHKLVCTQDSHAIDMVGFAEREKRVGALVREANLDFFEKNPDFAQRMTHHPPLISMWREHSFDGHRWAMAIDLNSCIGCGACIVACQAENNIPVVGKRRIDEGREMHWIRVDRYFSGDPANPQASHQPVACHHCELAPCEQVCPVAATVHSDEGLNDMVYNRCVGTRYCANNCPYKVRRFNYFAYDQDLSTTEKMKFNPEVTVRSRGVMEKCTYCVQRIQSAKIDAKNNNRDIADGDVVPACAQTCPARAITFGDLNDPHSQIHKMHSDDRAYAILAELNIKPRTAYLAKVRNPAPGTPEHTRSGPHLYEAHHGDTADDGHHEEQTSHHGGGED